MVVLQALVSITKHHSLYVRSHPITSSDGVWQSAVMINFSPAQHTHRTENVPARCPTELLRVRQCWPRYIFLFDVYSALTIGDVFDTHLTSLSYIDIYISFC